MRKLIPFALIFIGFLANAQQRKHNPADQIRSLNWDVIGTVKLELTEKNTLVPIFSETIKRFDQGEFQLQGYIIPIKSGQKQQRFMFSSLPVNQCFFCGQNGVPLMIMVEASTPVNYSDKPVRISGILQLESKDASFAPPVTIKNAKLIN